MKAESPNLFPEIQSKKKFGLKPDEKIFFHQAEAGGNSTMANAVVELNLNSYFRCFKLLLMDEHR